jgi:hypothetical protein
LKPGRDVSDFLAGDGLALAVACTSSRLRKINAPKIFLYGGATLQAPARSVLAV